MLQQSEYWSLVRVRLYALDAQLVRRGDVSTAEYQNIAYIYAFFKMQEYIADVISIREHIQLISFFYSFYE